MIKLESIDDVYRLDYELSTPGVRAGLLANAEKGGDDYEIIQDEDGTRGAFMRTNMGLYPLGALSPVQVAAAPTETMMDAMPQGPEIKSYDPTTREQISAFLQSGLEGVGVDRVRARKISQSLMGGPSSGAPLSLGIADIVPFLGTALQTEEAVRLGEDAAELAKQGKYTEAAVSAAGAAIGMIPGAAGTVQAARQVGELANVAGDKAVQAITGNPQATAMGALEAAGQISPVSKIAPGVKTQSAQPVEDDSRLLMPAFLDKTKKIESGFIKLNSPIKMKDGSTLSGFESADQRVFYGRDKNGNPFNVSREYVSPDDFVSSRDSNKTMEKIKTNLIESRKAATRGEQ
jgi:hypothetical protein